MKDSAMTAATTKSAYEAWPEADLVILTYCQKAILAMSLAFPGKDYTIMSSFILTIAEGYRQSPPEGREHGASLFEKLADAIRADVPVIIGVPTKERGYDA